MNGLVAFVGAGILVASLGFLLRELGFRGAPLVGALGIVLLFIYLLERVTNVLALLDGLASISGITELARIALRAVGIGYVVGISAEVCRQVGEGGVAKVIEGIGRVELLLISLPYIVKMVELVATEGSL